MADLQRAEIITIQTEDREPRRIAAWVLGPLAVHPDYGGDGWSVTHLRSGQCVGRGGRLILTEQQANSLAEGLLQAGLDWEWDDPKEMPRESRLKGRAVVAEVLGL